MSIFIVITEIRSEFISNGLTQISQICIDCIIDFSKAIVGVFLYS